MKYFVAFCLALLIGCSLVGCGDTVEKSNKTILNDSVIFTRFDERMYYDEVTKIVYIQIGTLVPYYASNGLPYRYNTETNTLEEIEWGICSETMTED